VKFRESRHPAEPRQFCHSLSDRSGITAHPSITFW
jgi:hypothetical protein